jgi:cell cycle sensor histidine kinase DivJ
MQEIESIQADVQNLKGMIGSFFAIGDAKWVAAEFHPVRLRPVIMEALRALATIYDLYDVQLDGSDFEIQGDALLLKRLFHIVLSNAKKHARCRCVQIHLTHDEKEGTVTIVDNGIGMRKEQLNQAFALFKPHPSASQGKGIGLVVARRLARLHGGDLMLQSQLGKGTTVRFRCPLHRA